VTLPGAAYKASNPELSLDKISTNKLLYCTNQPHRKTLETMTGFGSTSCGACKFLRRKCTSDCVFAPYFSYDQASTHFAAVHKIYGASNVSKLLSHLPIQNRRDAAITISYEALARMHDPIYGCVAHIYALQQQVSHAVTPTHASSHHHLVTSIPYSWIFIHSAI